jgi:hypothetical protein
MHKFIYPSKDSYINNSSTLKNKNFGIDEILEIYASNRGVRTEFTNPVWHPVPAESSSYGNEGWLAFDTSSLYIYSGSQWRNFSLTSGSIYGTSFVSNFSGRFSNETDSRVLYVSSSGGSTDFASGSFSGSFDIITDSYISGTFSTGSFSGSIKSGTSFAYLNVNGAVQTSPLTIDVTGTGSYKDLTGTIDGKANTGIPCSSSWYSPYKHLDSGSFNGEFSGSDWIGYVETSASSDLYYVDVEDFIGYFKGQYTGSFTRPTSAEYIIRPEYSRTLLEFDLNELSQSISDNEISSSNVEFFINLNACGMRNLPLDYTIYAYPISQSWENGNGRYANDGSTVGASWEYRNFSGGTRWDGPLTQSNQKVDYLLTSSYGSASFEGGGGTWYYNVPSEYTDNSHWICNSSDFPSLVGNELIASQSFSYGTQSDIRMNVTNIVRSWLCGCVPNNGLILITSFELSTPPVNNTNGLLQFYGRESNTIYSPKLDVKWDDSVFNTGSLSPLTGSTDNLINIQYLKSNYKAGSVPKIFVFSREKYPLKTFNKSLQQPSMVTPKYMPTSSYYMVKDADSEEVLIDFDSYSKLSCDASKGNYFKLDTSNLPQERYYRVLIKVEYDDGTVDIQDTNKIFKIVR